MKQIKIKLLLLPLSILLIFSSCNKEENKAGPQYKDLSNKPGNVFAASAVVYGLDNKNIKGTLRFEIIDEQSIKITGRISGLGSGLFAMHIHEFGACGGNGGENAGGHFNPQSRMHGAPEDSSRHAGDLGNIKSEGGTAAIEIIDTVLSLNGENSVIGRSVVIHERADDFKSQPAGNSGRRIACGVIGAAEK